MPDDYKVSVIRNISINPDSIDIGTPSKGGNCKVYFDAGDKEDAERRITNMIELRKFANMKLAEFDGVRE